MSYLCDVLSGSADTAGSCSGNGFEITRGASYGGASRPWEMSQFHTSKLYDFLKLHDKRNATVVFYFGSTLFHAMILGASKPWRGDKSALTLEAGAVVTWGVQLAVCRVRA